MSVRRMHEVWLHSRHKGSALLLLLAIADNADEERGIAWPAVPYLARKVRMSKSQVRRLLRVLARSGEITIQERHRPDGTDLPNVYMLASYEGGGSQDAPLPPRMDATVPLASGAASARSNHLREREPSVEPSVGAERDGPRSAPSTPLYHIRLPEEPLDAPRAFDGRHFSVSAAQLDEWQATFPGIDVLAVVRRCHAWVDANLKHAKRSAEGYKRWILRVWLGREQDRSGRPFTNGDRPPMQERARQTAEAIRRYEEGKQQRTEAAVQ